MPTYDYKCRECGHVFEVFHGINENPIVKCDICGSENTYKLIGGGAGIIFKGSGFYITDYKKKEAKSSETKTAKNTNDTKTKGEAKKKEAVA